MARLRRVKRRRVRRNARAKVGRKSTKRSRAGKKAWRTRLAKKAARAAAAKKAARSRKRRKTVHRKRRRTVRRKARGRVSRRRKRGWRKARRDHGVAGTIGWAGRKRRRSSKYLRSRGVSKRRLSKYRRRHKVSRRRKTPVSYWGRVAANPRKRRRRHTRRNSRRRSRRRVRRNSGRYLPIMRNPSTALSVGGFKTAVTDMFKTDFLKGMAQIAGGSLAVMASRVYVDNKLEGLLGIHAKIAEYAGEHAPKVNYVYNKAFALALTGILSYGAGAALKMLKVNEGLRRKVQTSIAVGGALVVAMEILTDAVDKVAELTGIKNPLADYLGDYATLPPMDRIISRQIAGELGDYASTLDYASAGADMRGLDFEDDDSLMAAMNDYATPSQVAAAESLSDYVMPESF